MYEPQFPLIFFWNFDKGPAEPSYIFPPKELSAFADLEQINIIRKALKVAATTKNWMSETRISGIKKKPGWRM